MVSRFMTVKYLRFQGLETGKTLGFSLRRVQDEGLGMGVVEGVISGIVVKSSIAVHDRHHE